MLTRDANRWLESPKAIAVHANGLRMDPHGGAVTSGEVNAWAFTGRVNAWAVTGRAQLLPAMHRIRHLTRDEIVVEDR